MSEIIHAANPSVGAASGNVDGSGAFNFNFSNEGQPSRLNTMTVVQNRAHTLNKKGITITTPVPIDPDSVEFPDDDTCIASGRLVPKNKIPLILEAEVKRDGNAKYTVRLESDGSILDETVGLRGTVSVFDPPAE